MPFKKTNADSKDARSLVEARKVFIGRRSELLFFIQHVLEPKDPTYNIISISGQGGISKSTLLSHFIDETQGGDFKDYCRVAQVNERQTTPADIMEKFAEQLSLKGDFEKALSQYKETLRRVQSEHEEKREALWRQATTDIAGSLVKEVPIMGGVLEEMAGSTIGYIWEEVRFRQRLKDAERLEDPIGDLTRNFVKELNQVADASITVGLDRIRRQKRVVLFFDTFEQLAAEAAPWLLDYFLEAEVSSNVVLVVAGREAIDRSTPDDPKRWLHHHDENVIHLISLERFTQDETRTYLAERGITDPAQIDTYWQLSRGLPLYLGLLTSNAQGNIDPTKDVVDNFLRWIPKQEQVKQRLALDAACFSRPFNQDDLAAFSYVPEQERSLLYRWLTRQPFVRSSPQDGRYLYHESAQDLFCRYLYQRSPDDYYATRRALTDYYRRLLNKKVETEGKDVYESAQWLELTLALAYQLFLLADKESHTQAIEQILTAYSQVGKAGEIVGLLHDFAQGNVDSQVSVRMQQSAGQLLTYMELQDSEDEGAPQGFLSAVQYLLEQVANERSFSTEPVASLYNQRGNAYQQLKQYQQALADYDQAITLNPKVAVYYGNRGNTYRMLEQYERAIADYSQAIRFEPTANRYHNLGIAYAILEQYEQAIADYDQAEALDPNDAYLYGNRGNAHYMLEQYEQAIADYSQAIRLEPTANLSAYLYGNRGNAYRRLHKDFERVIAGREPPDLIDADLYHRRGDAYQRLVEDYEQAIADYSQAIRLEPTANGYHNRGIAYAILEQYEQAIADYDRAEALDPDDAGLYHNRGNAYRGLKQYERAIADYSQAIRLEPTASRYHNRGIAYAILEQYEQAIIDYDRAITLHPNEADLYGERAGVYRGLNNYEQALADDNHALELAPNEDWPYARRGLTYIWLKDINRARTDYTRGWELNPTNIYNGWMIEWLRMCQERADLETAGRLENIAAPDLEHYTSCVCRGVALWIRGHVEEALAELGSAISLDLEPWDVYFWEGMIRASLGQEEEAMAAITRALELRLPPVLLTPLRWLDTDRQDFCEKYIEPLLTRYNVLNHQETDE